jgi:hypothetical protein
VGDGGRFSHAAAGRGRVPEVDFSNRSRRRRSRDRFTFREAEFLAAIFVIDYENDDGEDDWMVHQPSPI